MRNNLLSASVLGIGLVISSLIVANGAFAQTTPDTIKYPIAELGNCKSKEVCKNYCDDPSHIDACVTFAEKNNMMPPKQLAEAKQVQAAIAKGVQPPACNGKEECDAYCEEPSHMKECIAFGEAAGFLQGKDLEDAKKVLTAIDNGATPPACKGKEACDAYCSDRSHIEACMTFAQAAGLMTPEEAQNSDKMLAAIKKGVMPPNCSGKEGCDTYCAEPAHTDECINFSIAAGFMTEKEAEMAKKTGGKGPGGCIGKDACDTFCGNQDNQQTCIDFAKENGFDVESGGPNGGPQGGGFKPTTENGGTDASIRIGNCKNLSECTAYCTSHQTECQTAGVPDSQECVSGMPGYDMEKCQSYCSDHQELCDLARYNVAKSGNSPKGNQQQGEQGSQQDKQGKQQGGEGKQQNGNGPGGSSGGQNSGGPGGCKGPEACAAYCKDHLKECQEFVPQGGDGGQKGPANQQQQQQQPQPQPQNQQPNQQQDQQQQQGQQQNQQQNQPPPPEGQQTPGTLFVPKIEIEQGNQTPAPLVPQIEQAPPIEQTAPQSFNFDNFDLSNSFAAVITAFQKSTF